MRCRKPLNDNRNFGHKNGLFVPKVFSVNYLGKKWRGLCPMCPMFSRCPERESCAGRMVSWASLSGGFLRIRGLKAGMHSRGHA